MDSLLTDALQYLGVSDALVFKVEQWQARCDGTYSDLKETKERLFDEMAYWHQITPLIPEADWQWIRRMASVWVEMDRAVTWIEEELYRRMERNESFLSNDQQHMAQNIWPQWTHLETHGSCSYELSEENDYFSESNSYEAPNRQAHEPDAKAAASYRTMGSTATKRTGCESAAPTGSTIERTETKARVDWPIPTVSVLPVMGESMNTMNIAARAVGEFQASQLFLPHAQLLQIYSMKPTIENIDNFLPTTSAALNVAHESIPPQPSVSNIEPIDSELDLWRQLSSYRKESEKQLTKQQTTEESITLGIDTYAKRKLESCKKNVESKRPQINTNKSISYQPLAEKVTENNSTRDELTEGNIGHVTSKFVEGKGEF